MALSNYSYKISYRDIKYPRLELKTGKLLFVLPFGYDSNTLLDKHKNWIEKKVNFIEECLENAQDKKLATRTEEEFKRLINKVAIEISSDLNVKVNGIYFRKMKTKWASLSPSKNLIINKYMKYLPEYLIGYILFHETAHVIEKKHNTKFWGIIEKKYKNYQEYEKELFRYWFKVANQAGI